MNTNLRALGIAVLLVMSSQTANAMLFHFTQTGFSGGGTISGTFVADDLDHNGQISSFRGEVSAFNLTFSGDTIVPGFSHGLPALSGLVYDLGSGFIGDGNTGDIEGMASNWNGVFGYDFASGLGPTGGFGGRVIDIATGATSRTQNLIAVTVPEPGTLALFGIATAGLMGLRRRRT